MVLLSITTQYKQSIQSSRRPGREGSIKNGLLHLQPEVLSIFSPLHHSCIDQMQVFIKDAHECCKFSPPSEFTVLFVQYVLWKSMELQYSLNLRCQDFQKNPKILVSLYGQRLSLLFLRPIPLKGFLKTSGSHSVAKNHLEASKDIAKLVLYAMCSLLLLILWQVTLCINCRFGALF